MRRPLVQQRLLAPRLSSAVRRYRLRARLQEYADVGAETPLHPVLGYPHLEEAYRFAELVFPLLPLEHGANDKLPGQTLTGPFGEVVGNHYVPKASAS